jgi:hypothetical protein
MPGTHPAAIVDAEPTAAASRFDCRDCGACCASFRVSFYWAEADAFGLPEAVGRTAFTLVRLHGRNQCRVTALPGFAGRGRALRDLRRVPPTPVTMP